MTDVTAPTDEAVETPPNHVGKHAVEVACEPCGETVTIWVPDDCTDAVVRFEHPCGAKGEWVNPDALAAVIDPGPEDDVIWDAARQVHVPRVAQSAAEGGTSSEGIASTTA